MKQGLELLACVGARALNLWIRLDRRVDIRDPIAFEPEVVLGKAVRGKNEQHEKVDRAHGASVMQAFVMPRQRLVGDWRHITPRIGHSWAPSFHLV